MIDKIRKVAFIVFWVLFAVLMLGPIFQGLWASPNGYGWRQVLDAIRVVETGGMVNEGIGAIGDGGNALGPYQIWRPYWTDARMNCHRKYSDVLNDKELSEKVVYRYMMRYQPDAVKRLKAGTATLSDVEKIARTHNGGPRGYLKKSTVRYFEKGKRAL